LASSSGSLCGGLLPDAFSSLPNLPDSLPARYPALLSAAVLLVSAASNAMTRPRK
jgi:hypothetical protein